jgi:hypothetical protein
MLTLRSALIVFVVCLAASLAILYALGDHGPGSGLIKSSMAKEVKKHLKNCEVTKITFIRAGNFVPQAHRRVAKGTVFYPIRAEADYTSQLPDGSRQNGQAIRTLYFYKNPAGKWVYEVDSF